MRWKPESPSLNLSHRGDLALDTNCTSSARAEAATVYDASSRRINRQLCGHQDSPQIVAQLALDRMVVERDLGHSILIPIWAVRDVKLAVTKVNRMRKGKVTRSHKKLLLTHLV